VPRYDIELKTLENIVHKREIKNGMHDMDMLDIAPQKASCCTALKILVEHEAGTRFASNICFKQ
jgi:hypothetical protein